MSQFYKQQNWGSSLRKSFEFARWRQQMLSDQYLYTLKSTLILNLVNFPKLQPYNSHTYKPFLSEIFYFLWQSVATFLPLNFWIGTPILIHKIMFSARLPKWALFELWHRFKTYYLWYFRRKWFFFYQDRLHCST